MKTASQSGFFAEIAGKTDDFQSLIKLAFVNQRGECVVGASIVDADDFITESQLPQYGIKPVEQVMNPFGFIMEGKYDGKLGHKKKDGLGAAFRGGVFSIQGEIKRYFFPDAECRMLIP